MRTYKLLVSGRFQVQSISSLQHSSWTRLGSNFISLHPISINPPLALAHPTTTGPSAPLPVEGMTPGSWGDDSKWYVKPPIFQPFLCAKKHPCGSTPQPCHFFSRCTGSIASCSFPKNTGFPEKQTGKNPRELFPVALTGFTKERHRTLRRVLPTNQPTARLTLEALHLGWEENPEKSSSLQKGLWCNNSHLASPKRVTTFYFRKKVWPPVLSLEKNLSKTSKTSRTIMSYHV